MVEDDPKDVELTLTALEEYNLANEVAVKDDLIASDLGIDARTVLGDAGETLLTKDEREKVNKGVAHLTEQLTLDPESEVDLQAILKRALPVLSRLVAKLRDADTKKEATHWLDKTEKLIKHAATQ